MDDILPEDSHQRGATMQPAVGTGGFAGFIAGRGFSFAKA
jgi:hypothetical protein